MTEFSLHGQKLYLLPILDLYNGKIISYTISDRPTLPLVVKMLRSALKKIPKNAILLIHSDQGWQYQHKAFRNLLKGKGIQQSM